MIWYNTLMDKRDVSNETMERYIIDICPYAVKQYNKTFCLQRKKECDWFCGQAGIIKEIIRAGYVKITPLVDFVVTAGEISSMREKSLKDGQKEILQELYDEASRYEGETMSLNAYEIKKWAEKLGVKIEE